MLYLQIFITSFLITLVITPFVIRHLISAGIVDKPNKRKIHDAIIPRMGGVIVFIVSILVFLSFIKGIEQYRIFLISSIVIAIIGNLDDVFSLRWSHKLFAQVSVASLVTFDLMTTIEYLSVFGIVLPDFVSILLLISFIVGVLNAINFLDGLDGLVCGYSIISLVIILFIGYTSGNQFIVILSVGLLGSLLGFMKFNTYPARIFLGDTGSLSLAFFLIYLVLIASIEQTTSKDSIDFTFALIFFALPITDTLKVIVKRLSIGKSPFEPDKNHLHHKIIGLEVRQKISTFIIHLFTILFISLAYLYYDTSNQYLILLSTGLIIIVLFVPKIVYYFRERFFAINHHLKSFPSFVVKLFYYFFPIVSGIAIFFLLSPLVGKTSNFSNVELIYILILYIVLFIIAYNRLKSYDAFNNLFVFFNLIIFASLFQVSNGHLKYNLMFSEISRHFLLYIGVILTFGLLIYYVYIRERMNIKNTSLFYGHDLLLIVIMILIFIAKDIVSHPILEKFNVIFLTAFSLYSIYLLTLKIYARYDKVFFYLSFILPVLSIIALFILN
jgi:UDP-GlcNAc:undecaprenyl-phosphate GlcNAc-1-phosphate transferase